MNSEELRALEKLLDTHIGYVRNDIAKLDKLVIALTLKVTETCERSVNNRAWIKALYWMIGASGLAVAIWRISIFGNK
jgi:hypothetical protein